MALGALSSIGRVLSVIMVDGFADDSLTSAIKERVQSHREAAASRQRIDHMASKTQTIQVNYRAVLRQIDHTRAVTFRAKWRVESRCAAVALGSAYLFPPLSFGGASQA
jgi:hypothetical protein